MKISGIDSSRIQAMMEQLKAASSQPKPTVNPTPTPSAVDVKQVAKVDFAQTLNDTLQAVSDRSAEARAMSQRFAAGDNAVSLADTMVSMQKSSIAFQATVQVRNKVISAYTDIMNMQV
jgi:flagellar hook-basal body complex protein FliE